MESPNPANLSETAVRAAVYRWYLDDATDWIACLTSGTYPLTGHWAALIAALRPFLETPVAEVAMRLQNAGKGPLGALFDDLLTQAQPVSAGLWREATEGLDLIRVAEAAAWLANDAINGNIHTAQALLDAIAAIKPGTNGTTHAEIDEILWFGDPAREPDLQPPAPIVEDILYPGYTVAVGQWKKANKTRLMIALCFAIHNGIQFCGYKTQRIPCLWVQRDMPPEVFIDYTRKIRDGMQVTSAAIPLLARPCDLLKKEDQQYLIRMIKSTESNLIFLDSARAVSAVEENKSDSVRDFVRSFICDQLRDKCGVNVVLIAHPAKGGESVRGSGDWEAGADSVLHLIPTIQDREVQYITVHGEGRHPPIEWSFVVDDLVEHSGGWVVREITSDEQERTKQTNKVEKAEQRIMDWLKDNPGQHTKEAIRSGVRMRKDFVIKALVNLNGRGWIQKEEGNKGGDFWALTTTGASRSQSFPSRSGNDVSKSFPTNTPLGGISTRERAYSTGTGEVVPEIGNAVSEREPGEEG